MRSITTCHRPANPPGSIAITPPGAVTRQSSATAERHAGTRCSTQRAYDPANVASPNGSRVASAAASDTPPPLPATRPIIASDRSMPTTGRPARRQRHGERARAHPDLEHGPASRRDLALEQVDHPAQGLLVGDAGRVVVAPRPGRTRPSSLMRRAAARAAGTSVLAGCSGRPGHVAAQVTVGDHAHLHVDAGLPHGRQRAGPVPREAAARCSDSHAAQSSRFVMSQKSTA